MSLHSTLKITGLRENNLKSIDIEVEHDAVTVVCGPSGSGKSTFAFDTVYAEGARRYVETFNPYTRQFLDRFKAPDADSIENVRPGLALEQRNRITSSRSTVGTVTEINDYLKVLWASISNLHCPSCGDEIKEHSPELIIRELAKSEFVNQSLLITFRVIINSDNYSSTLDMLMSVGFTRVLDLDSLEIIKISDLENKIGQAEICVVVDRIAVAESVDLVEKQKIKSRLLSSLAQSYEFGKNSLTVYRQAGNRIVSEEKFTCKLFCPKCEREFVKRSPALFTFNSPIGACDECKGFGKVLKIDPKKCILNEDLSIEKGAISCWSGKLGKKQKLLLHEFCKIENIPLGLSWKKLSFEQKRLVLEGPDKKSNGFVGVLPWFDLISRKRHKMHIRIFVAKHRSEFLCPSCSGSRLTKDSLCYRIFFKNIFEVMNLSIKEAQEFFKEVSVPAEIKVIKNELISRLSYLNEVGLSYLTLGRQTKTLSGGEFQRVNLTTLLGANLVNSMFVLDEPTIGLHSRDTKLLIQAVRRLAMRGNSILVVEHDPEVISEADSIIELGPESGSAGGSVVYQGSVAGLLKKKTKTAKYFLDWKRNSEQLSENKREFTSSSVVKISNANLNNLKNVCIDLPLNNFVVLCGVSGSGKSTLLHECLYRAYEECGLSDKIETDYVTLSGLEHVSEIVLIDQQPLGKNSRANPATYTKVWDDFRDYFAETDSSIKLGLSRSSFSFNVDGGRCPVCKGKGVIKIEMQFLTDVQIECEDCLGQRFRDQILAVKLGDKNVMNVLRSPIADVVSYVKNLPNERRNKSIINGLMPLIGLGLGYLTLGQSLSSLSGGEAQRLKLASFLKARSKNKIFILDEPTTGLHPSDISNLINALRQIQSSGNSIICIEHNLDVIREADWMIELGPEGGEGGGRIVATGEPLELMANMEIETATVKGLREELVLNQKKKSSRQTKRANKNIKIVGAREHNLKNVSLEIPDGKLSVVTGLSGSGKSTLAFDILFSEGQRRFIDCLSPYARQYISQVSKPDVDTVESLPPTIAVSQKIAPPSGISTLATVSEVYQYLRLLFSKVGIQHCVKDGEVISDFSQDLIIEDLIKDHLGETIYIFSPMVMGRKGHYGEIFERAARAELSHAIIDGEYQKIFEGLKLERHKLHWISLEIGRIKVTDKSKEILSHAVSQALVTSQGSIEIAFNDPYSKPVIYSLDRVCPKCKKGYLPLDPQDFSFRSARGTCQSCNGTGQIEVSLKGGIIECPECQGARVGEIARNVKVSGKTIYELTQFKAPGLKNFLANWKFPSRLKPIVDPVLNELFSLLDMLDEVGLNYLSLDRDASTLSGGEAQRLRLAKNLGAPLTGVCYVLDEPSIGLHAADHGKLMQTLRKIRDQGNTIVVVEHDEETIVNSDYIIDVGPNAGSTGGNIVFTGEFADLLKCEVSKTAEAFNQKKDISDFKSSGGFNVTETIGIRGAKTNNLKSVDVDFPIGALTTVVGVSGAGKSSLVHGTLIPAILEEFEGERERAKFYQKTWVSVSSIGDIDRMIEIDQKPIGKTPSSTPASFLGLFDEIRKLFALLPESKIRGFNASHFSYNTGKGRCMTCGGRGYVKIPMSFLPDALSECEACGGYRYNEETLEVKYNELSIGDILKLTMTEAKEVLRNYAKVRKILEYACDLGIGYICLGQASHTLSGGEAQRLKIVKEFSAKDTSSCLYVLDEPTIGLHMLDVKKLVDVLRKLVEKGNTVVVIEHNFDVLLHSDYVIDIGPGPGEAGGDILYQGTIEKYLRSKKVTPTLSFLKNY